MTALPQAEQLQYLINVEGERTAVVVPIQAWEQILAWHQQTAEYQSLKKGLTAALREAKATEAGEVPKRALRELKEQLNTYIQPASN